MLHTSQTAGASYGAWAAPGEAQSAASLETTQGPGESIARNPPNYGSIPQRGEERMEVSVFTVFSVSLSG